MPPRTRADHLTEEQLGELSNALAEGRRATVYLIDGIPSLGIEPGASARVVSVSGTTVMVRPKGVDDELPFESDELRLTRQPAGAPAKKTAATKSAPAKAAASTSPAVTPSAGRPAATKPAAPQPVAAGPAAAKPASRPAPPVRGAQTKSVEETKPVNDTTPGSAAPASPAKPKAPARKGKKAPTISITITIDPESEWTVGIAHGTRKVGKPAAVAPDAVERAVKELGDPGAVEAVQSVIDAARSAAEERVAQLSRELEEARKALESLGATPKTGIDL
ncbi:DUF6319 family protein [Rhodococcus sp. 105337]|uniref:DUF6319 family protein n=1 Tax=unclassified Rhodococcus (in: high G+C Gram-positive bacteria) TaxID=192944 RepID=UPI00146F7429|nr:DUF6319 family protein [Rhodococcus sp. 105337]NME81417.1 translation initiation factor [Rhodococcus sp. 105337]